MSASKEETQKETVTEETIIEEEIAPRRRGVLRRCLFPLAWLSVLGVTGLAVVAFFFPNVLPWRLDHVFQKQLTSPEASPDPEKYSQLKADLELNRLRLAQRYRRASTQAEKNAILLEAQNLLEATLPEMMRCWLGTPWDFNGTSTQPGKGKIACGYYVSVIMRDAGFRVERIRLAQQPSQNILGTFLPRSEMQVRVGKSYEDYLREVKNTPHGIHIVGLDRHVAFIVHSENEFRFIHSSGGHEKQVVDEAQNKAHALKYSNYRVIGNVTANRSVLLKWLQNEPFPTQTS